LKLLPPAGAIRYRRPRPNAKPTAIDRFNAVACMIAFKIKKQRGSEG
jgi:hypothetical protein